MLIPGREANHQRDVQAGVVERSFETRDPKAVVGEEEYYRIVGKSVGLELGEYVADLPVHERDKVVVAGPYLSHKRCVRVVRGQGDPVGLVAMLGLEGGPVLGVELVVGSVDLYIPTGPHSAGAASGTAA